MCKELSLLLDENGTVYGYDGLDSHSRILERAGLDRKRDEDYAKIEIYPANDRWDKPVEEWELVVDHAPKWWNDGYRQFVLDYARQYRSRKVTVRKNGTYSVKSWYTNGQLMEYENRKNGVLDGNRKCWYSDGQFCVDDNWKDGVLDGNRKSWWSNGQLCEDENWKDGKLVRSI